MPKRLLSGVVVSSNSNKTIVVEVTRRVKHKLYKKIIKRTNNNNIAKLNELQIKIELKNKYILENFKIINQIDNCYYLGKI